jgi:hypothetical protein
VPAAQPTLPDNIDDDDADDADVDHDDDDPRPINVAAGPVALRLLGPNESGLDAEVRLQPDRRHDEG